jgi:CheY-like chemotaxis protein
VSRVFDEFVQIENPLQRRVKGTGLGLPLSKRLAELLGGRIGVVSELGVGSTFSLTVPLVYRDPLQIDAGPIAIDPQRVPVLVVEDNDEDLLLVGRALSGTRYQLLHGRTPAAADAILSSVPVAAVVLDIRLQGAEAWDLLARIKRDASAQNRPVIVLSTVDDQRKGYALGADAYHVKPLDPIRFVQTLDRLVATREAVRVLAVDDEEASRFIIRQLLNDRDHELVEAATGVDGLAKAHEAPPDVILLDLRLTDMTGFDLFEQLRHDPATARVPVVVVTSQRLSDDDQRRLSAATAVLSKSSLTRSVLRTAIANAVTSQPRI